MIREGCRFVRSPSRLRCYAGLDATLEVRALWKRLRVDYLPRWRGHRMRHQLSNGLTSHMWGVRSVLSLLRFGNSAKCVKHVLQPAVDTHIVNERVSSRRGGWEQQKVGSLRNAVCQIYICHSGAITRICPRILALDGGCSRLAAFSSI